MCWRTAPILIVGLIICVISAGTLKADWQQNGTLVYAAPTTHNLVIRGIFPDGSGGTIVIWQEQSSWANYGFRAQRIDANGSLLWPGNGVSLGTALYSVIPDGVGGLIIWNGGSTGSDIVVQRFDGSGSAVWGENGLSIDIGFRWNWDGIQFVADGTGGAIFVWPRWVNQTNFYLQNSIAQRIDASGALLWGSNGLLLVGTEGEFQQNSARLVSDGQGGAIFVFLNYEVDGDYQPIGASASIRGQRIAPSGLAMWGEGGVSIPVGGDFNYPVSAISSDGLGGVIVWGGRNGAQRIDASGSALWASSGVPIPSGSIADGLGSIFADWSFENGIHAQRFDARNGSMLWSLDGGVRVTQSTDTLTYYGGSLSQPIPDGSGGAIIAWLGSRQFSGPCWNQSWSYFFAQRLNAAGSLLWSPVGKAICEATWLISDLHVVSDNSGGIIAAWQDGRSSGISSIYAQRVAMNGSGGTTPTPSPNPTTYAPRNLEVRDVPRDQGGKVTVTWDAAFCDRYGGLYNYSIWRRLSSERTAELLKNGKQLKGPEGVQRDFSGQAYFFSAAGDTTYGWEWLANMDALNFDKYTYTASTPYDSVAGHTGWQRFIVVAHGQAYWKSESDSGYSVDNLSPYPPRALAGQQSFTPAGLRLTWDRNTEADLGNYHVYRGVAVNFVPTSGNLIASPRDTTLLDSGWQSHSGYYYKVSAIDIHGNESGFALLAPDDISGGETPKGPAATYLAQNFPNPFNPMTRIAFGLANPAGISLSVYDAAGRLVRTLAEGDRPAANYTEVWDGKDASGRAVSSGIYFYRLSAGAFTETKKMVLLR